MTDSPAAHLQDCVSVPLAVGKDQGKLSANFFTSFTKIKLEYTVSCLSFLTFKNENVGAAKYKNMI